MAELTRPIQELLDTGLGKKGAYPAFLAAEVTAMRLGGYVSRVEAVPSGYVGGTVQTREYHEGSQRQIGKDPASSENQVYVEARQARSALLGAAGVERHIILTTSALEHREDEPPYMPAQRKHIKELIAQGGVQLDLVHPSDMLDAHGRVVLYTGDEDNRQGFVAYRERLNDPSQLIISEAGIAEVEAEIATIQQNALPREAVDQILAGELLS